MSWCRQVGDHMRKDADPRLDYRRGRSGRPYERAKSALKREGSHVCIHCGKSIDLTLPSTDKWSWTLEHVVPLHHAPELALDPRNHAEAHRFCNESRGTKPIAPRVIGSRSW